MALSSRARLPDRRELEPAPPESGRLESIPDGGPSGAISTSHGYARAIASVARARSRRCSSAVISPCAWSENEVRIGVGCHGSSATLIRSVEGVRDEVLPTHRRYCYVEIDKTVDDLSPPLCCRLTPAGEFPPSCRRLNLFGSPPCVERHAPACPEQRLELEPRRLRTQGNCSRRQITRVASRRGNAVVAVS